MKTLVLFYSYSGHTKKIAAELAAKESADIAEVMDVKRPGRIKAYTSGIFASMKGKSWPSRTLGVDMAAYDRLILLAPIWADSPAPVFNGLLEKLPENKTVSVKMISASGKSNCRERVEAAVREKACFLESFEDIKA